MMRHTSIPGCFVARAHQTPDAVALSEGEARLTYQSSSLTTQRSSPTSPQ
jgi:hypothetical protein